MQPSQTHPCEADGCYEKVAYDDEPYCFTHSPDEGSSVRGYSYQAKHANDEPFDESKEIGDLITRNREAEAKVSNLEYNNRQAAREIARQKAEIAHLKSLLEQYRVNDI